MIPNNNNFDLIMRAEFSKEKIRKRKIHNKKDIMKEMYACKECDCESYPWCTCLGGLCRECVDLEYYVHKRPLRSQPGIYKTDINSIKKERVKVTYPHIEILKTPLDGDCLYKAIALAFDEKITVEDLRHLVARYQTHQTFETYKELSSFMPEYRTIRAAHSLRDFRVLIKKTGENMGPSKCVWGDENALQIIATSFRLGLMIFNQKGQFVQKIVPERTSTYNDIIPRRYILLLLNSGKAGNEHYNLLKFNKHKLLTKFEWSKMKNIISSQQRK